MTAGDARTYAPRGALQQGGRTDEESATLSTYALTPTATARKHLEAWRAHNRRRWALEKDVLPMSDRAPFVCECTDAECRCALELTMADYEAGHLCPHWCTVAPGHVLVDDGTTVLARHPHFWVVEPRSLVDLPEEVA